MISRATPSTIRVCPTAGVAPKRRCQYPCEITTVGAAPGRSSAAVKVRPATGVAPRICNTSCVISRLVTDSGSPSPLTVTGELSQSQWPMASNVRL